MMNLKSNIIILKAYKGLLYNELKSNLSASFKAVLYYLVEE